LFGETTIVTAAIKAIILAYYHHSINQSSLRLLNTPLTRTQRGLQEQKYKHEK